MDAFALSKVLVRYLALVLWCAALLCLVLYAVESMEAGEIPERLHDRYYVISGGPWLALTIALMVLGGLAYICASPLARLISHGTQ